MGAGHSHLLYVHEHSRLHRMAPQAKILGALGIVVPAALTPREAVWAFGLYATIVGVLLGLSRIPLRFFAIRLVVVAPFVAFAVLIPFIATGETTQIGGVTVSVPGLWGAWNIIAKAMIGASVSIVLTATTEIPDILRGLRVLRVPTLFTAIAMFMVRYLELVVDELRRMRVAMTARGYNPRWLAQARPIASSAGALFVRSYERGERVHAAMLARGFSGGMPAIGQHRATTPEWLGVGGVALTCILILATALVVS